MRVGSPKEIKNNENRIGLTPDSAKVLIDDGHEVFIETGAGEGIGCLDSFYEEVGADIVSLEDLYKNSELIIKVKEPTRQEHKLLNSDHTLFTYLHLAGDKELTLSLAKTGLTAIAYETVTSDEVHLPLLSPMSKIAGQLAFVVGSYNLLSQNQGIGKLLGFDSQFDSGTVTIVGAGTAGVQSLIMAKRNNAKINVIDVSEDKLNELKKSFGEENIQYIKSSEDTILEAVAETDLLIGAVHVVGKSAPKIITHEMIKEMPSGSVFVDISIDQGGCGQTSKPTTHDEPTYLTHDVIHYCVTNMPGSVPITSTFALNKATLPYVRLIAEKGLEEAFILDEGLQEGLNIKNGKVVHKSVTESLGL
jgi:alanine dehydrogenase